MPRSNVFFSSLVFSAFALLGFGGGAYADDSDANSSGSSAYEANRLDTLHYRVEQHQSEVGLSFQTRVHDGETDTVNGTASNVFSTSSFTTTADYVYGISDKLLVSITESYLNFRSESDTDLANNTAGTRNASGFSDPTLHVNYRFLGELTGDHFGSAYVNLTPAFGTAQGANLNGATGNNLNASTEISAGANFYWVTGKHEWLAEADIHYFSSGTFQNSDPAASETDDSRFTEGLTGQYRYHFCDKFFGQATLNITLPYNYNSMDNFQSDKHTIDLVLEPALEIGWSIRPNLVTYAVIDYQDYNGTFTPSISNKGTFERIQSFLTVGANYVF